MAEEKQTASEYLERQIGSEESVAAIVCELESAAFGAYEMFRYEEPGETVTPEWLAACKLLMGDADAVSEGLRIFPREAPDG